MNSEIILDFIYTTLMVGGSIKSVSIPVLEEKELSLYELKVLRTLRKAGTIKTSELGQKLGIRGSTLTGVLDRLERMGLLQRHRDEVDRRVVFVTVTEAFEAEDDRIQNFVAQRTQEALDGFSEEELELLTQKLRMIAKQLGSLDAKQK